jgi:trimethylamine:corrinoid methyltransferase-like protein
MRCAQAWPASIRDRSAVDRIKLGGPVPGNFLKTEHRRRHWRDAYVIPRVGVREGCDARVNAGSKGVVERATEEARRLIAAHQVTPLPPEMDRDIAHILQQAEEEKM